ncbi:MAG: hypothetical protein AB1813_10180 [Verrucomicrobiota bacterium]
MAYGKGCAVEIISLPPMPDEIDERLGWQDGPAQADISDEEAFGAMAEVARPLLSLILGRNRTRVGIGSRAVVIGKLFGAPEVAGFDLSDLAEELKVTRQALSALSVRLRNELGLVARWMHKPEARERMRASALRAHRRKKNGVAIAATPKLENHHHTRRETRGGCE